MGFSYSNSSQLVEICLVLTRSLLHPDVPAYLFSVPICAHAGSLSPAEGGNGAAGAAACGLLVGLKRGDTFPRFPQGAKWAPRTASCLQRPDETGAAGSRIDFLLCSSFPVPMENWFL